MDAEKMFSYLENLVGEIPAIILSCCLAIFGIIIIILMVWVIVKKIKRSKTTNVTITITKPTKKTPTPEELGLGKDDQVKYGNWWKIKWRMKKSLLRKKKERTVITFKKVFKVKWDVKRGRYVRA